MLRQRILTSIIIIPICILIIWLGNPWFGIIMALFAAIGSFEFYRLVHLNEIKSLHYLGAVFILLLVVSPICPIPAIKSIIITIALIATLIWLLFQSSIKGIFNNWAWTIAGIFYIGWTLSYWIEIRELELGRYWAFWALAIIVFNDTFAFFIGRAIGKHPLASSISPNKTWEGAIGGCIMGIVASIILGMVFPLQIVYWQMIVFGLVISLFAQLGDLVESLLKRSTEVKDSGNLLPGHGGVLDRLDSFFLTGPVLFYCITYFIL